MSPLLSLQLCVKITLKNVAAIKISSTTESHGIIEKFKSAHALNRITLFKRTGIAFSGVIRYFDIIEKYGCYMNRVTLANVDLLLLKSSQQSHNQLNELLDCQPLHEFMDQHPLHELLGQNPLCTSLNQCVILQHLKIERTAFTNLNFPYLDSTRKKAIEYLSLIACTFENTDVLKTLSSLFSYVKILEFSKVMSKDDFGERMLYNYIELMETDIDTLFISKNSSSAGGYAYIPVPKLKEERVILVSITIQNLQTRYYYDFDSVNNYKFKRMRLEYFIYCKTFMSDAFVVDVRCKSLGALVVKHRGKDIRLSVDTDQ